MNISTPNALPGLQSISDPRSALFGLFEDAPMAYQLYAADGHCVAVNRAFHALFGAFPLSNGNELWSLDFGRPGFSELARRALAGEPQRAPVYWYEAGRSDQLESRDLHSVAIQATFIPLRDGAGQVRYLAVSFVDVTAETLLRSTTEALEQSERRFRATFEQAAVGIAHVAPNGTWLEVNRRLCDIVGYTPEELRVRTFQDITYPPDLDADLQLVQRVLSGALSTYSLEKRYVRKDGSLVWIDLTVSLVRDAAGAPQYFISVIQDISSRKRAEEHLGLAHQSRVRAERALEHTEEQLRQSQKMEAIGVLAGNVAHDFNNVLSIILGHSELLLDDVQAGDPVRDGLTQIQRAAESAAQLTRQLLAFGRCQVLEPRVVSLNVAVSGMTRMLHRIIGEDIELAVLLAPDLGSTFVDPSQMDQVLLNLVVNARDAMPQGGKLTIETADAVLDEAYARSHMDVTAGRYVMLSVSDTGAGMDLATQARVFEPFFTTKAKGKGTGLGLSSAYGIVKQSGGSIWVQSEVGKGTVFKVYLPRTEAPIASAAGLPLTAPRRGHETVLLVEDDERVRALAAAVLRRQGYVVLEAPSGGDALLICEQFLGRIDLLLTDVVMPHMSGRQLWERLSVLRPSLRVLFISGHTDDAILRHGVLNGDLKLVQKPLTPSALLEKVRSALDLDD